MTPKALNTFLLFPTLQPLAIQLRAKLLLTQELCCLVKETGFHSSVLQILADGYLAGFLCEQALANLTDPSPLGWNSQSFIALNLSYLAQMGTGVDQRPAHIWTPQKANFMYEQQLILATKDRWVLVFIPPAFFLSKSLRRRESEFPHCVTVCSPDFKPGRNEGKPRGTQHHVK